MRSRTPRLLLPAMLAVPALLGATGCSSDPSGGEAESGPSVQDRVDEVLLPRLSVVGPSRGAFVGTGTVEVKGHVSKGGAPIESVTVNDAAAQLDDNGDFRYPMALEPGLHVLSLRATDADAQRAVDGRAVIAGDVHPPGDTLEGGVHLQLSRELLDDNNDDVDDVARLAELLLEDPSLMDAFVGQTMETDYADITPTYMSFSGASVDLVPRDGRLEATLVLYDLWMDFDAEAGWFSTQGSAWADTVTLDVELMASDSGGKLEVLATSSAANLEGYGITVDWFPDSWEGWLADYTEETLEEEISATAEELVGDLVGEYLGAFAVSTEMSTGLLMDLELASLDVFDEGLVIGLDAAFTATSTGISLPQGAGSVVTPAAGPELPIQSDAPFVVVADDDVVNQLFFAFWQLGVMEGLTFGGVELGGLSGGEIPPPLGPVEEVSLSLGLPPVISDNADPDYPATFGLGELRMDFTREDGQLLEFFVNAEVGMEISFADDGELGLALDKRPAEMLLAVGVGEHPEALDPGDLAALVRLMVPPLLGNAAMFLPGFETPGIPLDSLGDLDAFEGLELRFQDPDLIMVDGGHVLLTGSLSAEQAE